MYEARQNIKCNKLNKCNMDGKKRKETATVLSQ